MGTDPPRTTEYVEQEVTGLGTPYLEVVRGAPFGKPTRLGLGSTLIGRDEQADLRFDVTGVSRKHARISMSPAGDATLVDLGSRNGTFLNGRRIETAPLRNGDEIRVGQAVIRLRYLGGAGRVSMQPDDEPPPSLSPREYEVARLVAEGFTNAEVGKRLSISPATVGRHLSNIYERLDIHSRAALAKYVMTAPRGSDLPGT